MKFFIDNEFNGFGGELISMAIVCDTHELYLVNEDFDRYGDNVHPWVLRNVSPWIYHDSVAELAVPAPKATFKKHLSRFFYDKVKSEEITIVADWYTDVEHLMNVLVADNGYTVTLNRSRKINIEIDRTLDQARDPLSGSIEHNALWDARNIRKDYMRRYNVPQEEI